MSGHDGDDNSPREDADEKTAALSLDELGLDDDGGEATAALSLDELGLEPQPPTLESDDDEKTAAFSLEDMGIPQEPEEPQADAPADEAGEDEEDKTAAFSLEDMGIAQEQEEAQVDASADEAGEDEEDKTAAFSLEDMGIAPEPEEAQADEAAEDEEDKTAAFSLEDMGIPQEPEEALSEPPIEDKTAAMSLEDMGITAEPQGEDKTAAMSLEDMGITAEPQGEDKTAAMSLEEMGIAQEADEEKTAAMSLEDMGVAPKAPPPELEVRAGNDRGESFVVSGDSVLVGRGLDCDIVLNDASVSRKHFRLDKTPSGYKMVDLGSGNGTKINGVRLSEFDLAHGSILEAGTTTMAWKQLDKPAAPAERKEAWEDNGESTRVSDLAAISVLPEWADQVEKEDKAKAVVAQRGPLKMIVMLLSIILGLTLGFMALDKALNMGIVFDDGKAAEADRLAAEAAREAIGLMNEGREAFAEREWNKARKKFKAAIERDADVREGQRYLERTKAEKASFKALRKGRAALDEEEYEEAIAELKKVDDRSLYFSDDGEGGEGASDLLGHAIGSFVEAQLLESQRLDEDGDNKGALAAIDKALAVAPDDASALALKVELSEADEGDDEVAPPKQEAKAESPKAKVSKGGDKAKRSKARAERREAKAAAKAKATESKPKTKSAAPKSKRSTKSAGMLTALTSYARGDFDAAIGELEGLSKRGSRKKRAKAKRLASAIKSFRGTYAEATRAAKGFRSPSKAIKALRAARTLDASISGAYSKKIRQELARMLAFQANQAFASKKYGKAGRHARQALALDPNLSQAKKIYTEVQAQAQGWFDQAKAAAGTNPDKAMQLLSRVVSIFPRGDQRYKEAYKLLNQLAVDEED